MFIDGRHPLFWPMVGGVIMWLCFLLFAPLIFNISSECLRCGWGVFLFGLVTAFIRHPGE